VSPKSLSLAALLVLGATEALAVERSYGLAAGPASTLGPATGLGAALALSAAASGDSPGSLLRARGELVGILGEGCKAALPTLVGDVGLRFERGALELFLTGGIQIFGVASRADYTVFSTLGLIGGAGLSARMGRRLRLTARGLAIWLPGDAAARLAAPEGAPKPTYALLMVLIGLDLGAGRAPDEAALDE
jgi:hypothetical protein